MEQARKNLKVDAIVVLVLAAFTLVQLIVELCCGTVAAVVKDNPALALATTITAIILTVLLLLPQLFVGVRGLQVAKNPAIPVKAARIWAFILLLLAALAVISNGIAIFSNQQNVLGDATTAAASMAEVIIYYDFIKNSEALQK